MHLKRNKDDIQRDVTYTNHRSYAIENMRSTKREQIHTIQQFLLKITKFGHVVFNGGKKVIWKVTSNWSCQM